jgi:hypothetical protein
MRDERSSVPRGMAALSGRPPVRAYRPWIIHYAGKPYPGPLPSGFTEVAPAAKRLRACLAHFHSRETHQAISHRVEKRSTA